MGLAISTSWNAFRNSDGVKIVSEVKRLGFQEVELSFDLTPEILEGIERLTRDEAIRVVSLHNFCPIPDSVRREEALPDHYSMASLDETERQLAVRFTKRTIDTAKRFAARAVVLHAGRVEIPDRTRELTDLYVRGEAASKELAQVRSEVLAQREAAKKPYLESALKSLDELERYARDRGILLGIENRYYYREIPSFEEIGVILAAIKGSAIRYWHDVGHAQLMENLGFTTHKEFLDTYAHSLLGMHLHDITGYHDHKAPSRGTFDFNSLIPYITKDTVKVIEAHYPATAGEIKTGKKFLEHIFDGKV